jgi:hypothetical protein
VPSDSVKNGNPADLTSNDINIMSTDKTEKNPLIESMPELNRRIMKLFQTAEAEADTSRGALDATQIANTTGRLATTVVRLANNRRDKVEGYWLDFIDPDAAQKQRNAVDAPKKAEVTVTDLESEVPVDPRKSDARSNTDQARREERAVTALVKAEELVGRDAVKMLISNGRLAKVSA